MKKSLAIAVISGMVVCGCASSRPYHLTPVEPVQRWESGQAVVESRDKGLLVSISFEHVYDDTLSFDVELTNSSDRAIIVSPKKFYYEAAIIVDQGPTTKRVLAIDPEKMILELDKRITDETDDQDNEQAVHLLFSFIECGFDIAEIAGRKEGQSQAQRDKEQHEEEQDKIDYTTRMSAYDGRISDLKQERQVWMKQTLRKTTLAAHQRLKGKVIFPLVGRPDAITLFIPVGDCMVSFAFQHDGA